MKLHF
jgi:hypothetical protein